MVAVESQISQALENELKGARVSIIIPIYNVIQYLDACIDSAIHQDYHDLEIILVDDGSTDGSGGRCDDYAAGDARIRVIHKENGGLSDARNAGMAAATGEYYYFLDGDDVMARNAISIMVRCMEESGADLVIAGYHTFSESDNYTYAIVQGNHSGQGTAETLHSEETSVETPRVESLTPVQAIRRMLLHQGIGYAAWGKLYARRLWEDMQFPKGLLYEDHAVIFRITARCRRVAVLDELLYDYRVRQGSIMNQRIDERNLVLLDIADNTTRFITGTYPELRCEAEYLQLVNYLKLLKLILDNGFDAYPAAQSRILQYVQDHRYLMRYGWYKRVDRIKVGSLLLNRHLFYWLYILGDHRNARRHACRYACSDACGLRR